MGALDWRASAVAMWIAQISSVVAVAWWSQAGAVPLTLRKLWGALAVLLAAQTLPPHQAPSSSTEPVAHTRPSL